MEAAILLEKLAIFPEELIKRNQVADYYLKNIPENMKTIVIPEGYLSSWAQFSILAENSSVRTLIMEQLKENGIPSMIYYRTPLHLQKVFSELKYKRGDFPASERTADSIFSIPIHPYMEKVQQDQILEVLHAIT